MYNKLSNVWMMDELIMTFSLISITEVVCWCLTCMATGEIKLYLFLEVA